MPYLLLLMLSTSIFSSLYGSSWFTKKAAAARIAKSPQIKNLRTELERLNTALKKTTKDLKKITNTKEKDIAQNRIASLNESIARLKSNLNLEKQILAQKEQTPLRKLINKDKARLALKKRASQAAAITAGTAAAGGAAYGAYKLATLPDKEDAKETLPAEKEFLDNSKDSEQSQQKIPSQEPNKNNLLENTSKEQKEPPAKEPSQENTTSANTYSFDFDADSFLKKYEPTNNWQQDFSSE